MDVREHKVSILRRLVKNSFFLIITRVADFAVVIFTTPLIARYLGLSVFGDYAWVLAVTIFVKPFVEFGSEAIICRDVAREKDNPAEYINSALLLRVLLSVLLVALTLILPGFFVSDPVLRRAIYIGVAAEALISFSTVFFAVIRAYERMEYEFVSNIVAKVFYVAAVIYIVVADMGFIALFWGRLFFAAIFLLLSLYFVFRHLVAFAWKASWATLRFILSEAFPLVLFTLTVTLTSRIDVFLLKYFRDSSEVALFEASNRVITQLQFIPLAISISMFPLFSRLFSEPDAFRSNTARGAKFLYILSIMPAALLALNSEVVITLLFGDKFKASGSAFLIMSFSLISLALIPFMHNILTIMGRQTLVTLSVVISFVFNLCLDILLIRPFGYIGASIATLTASFVLFFATIFFVSRLVKGIDYAAVFIRPTLVAIASAAVCYLFASNTVFSLFLTTIIGSAIYLFLLFAFRVFGPEDIEMVKGFFGRRRAVAPGK